VDAVTRRSDATTPKAAAGQDAEGRIGELVEGRVADVADGGVAAVGVGVDAVEQGVVEAAEAPGLLLAPGGGGGGGAVGGDLQAQLPGRRA
jgi:hypothetical protein